MEFVDIYPTLCELCGLKPPENLEGYSFAPLLNAPEQAWKKAAFSQYPRQAKGVGPVMGHSMRTERYRLTEWLPRNAGGDYREVEVYDYQADPNESVNIASKPGNEKLLRDLTAQLRAGWKAALPRV